MLALSVMFSRLFRKRFIFGVHNFIVAKILYEKVGPVGRIWNSLYAYTLSKIKVFHVTNERDLKALRSKFPNATVEYIPNFITDPGKIVKCNKKEFICLYVGRLEKSQKGVDLFVEIIKSTVKKNKNIIFEIAGSGGDGESLVASIAKEYPKNVRWLGFVTGEPLEKAYEVSNLYILPSRGEAFSLSTLESQSRGLPAITFDIPGPRGILKKPFQGRLVKPFDIDLFSDAILEYYKRWQSNAAYARTKKEISALVNREYSTERIIPKLKKLLSKGV